MTHLYREYDDGTRVFRDGKLWSVAEPGEEPTEWYTRRTAYRRLKALGITGYAGRGDKEGTAERFSVYLYPYQIDAVERMAAQESITKAEVVRRCLNIVLRQTGWIE